jgi:hypothetical protein
MSSDAVEQEKQQEEVRKQATIDKIKPTGSAWDEYFNKLKDKLNKDYMDMVIDYAKRDEYRVTFRRTSNREPKIYKREKPSVKEFKEVEIDRAKFEMMTKPEQKLDVLNAAAEIYLKCAKMYFGMSQDEFEDCSWEDIKLILDACNFRTLYGIPFSRSD